MKFLKILFVTFILALSAVMYWYLQTPNQKEFHLTTLAPSKFIDIDGLKIHYIQNFDPDTAGDNLTRSKPAKTELLLIHGFASSTYVWHRMWPLLSEYNVTAMDLPGFGLSEKSRKFTYGLDEQSERLKHFIEKIYGDKSGSGKNGATRPVQVVAWSMGALIVLNVAKANPSLFERLFLITPAVSSDIPAIPVWLADWTAPFLAGWFVTPQYIRMSFKYAFAKPMANEMEYSLISYYPYSQGPDAFYALISGLHLLTDNRIPAELAGITVPMKIMIGDKDRTILAEKYSEFLKMYPSVPVIHCPEAGHGIMVDDPEWVLEQIQEN